MQNNNTNNNQKNIADFLRYNNAVPLFVAIAIVVSGSAFAATPTGQETISQTLVGKTEKVISVDNTYIAAVDLTSWTPRVRVTGVKEDTDNYYVAYILSTIDVKDYKWQNVDEENTLKVDKTFLKEFKSLQDYVKYELAQKIDAEKDRLARTQEIEKKNITQMQVVTSYSGLAGLVIDDTTSVGDPFAPAPESLTPGPVNNGPTSTPLSNEVITNATSTVPEQVSSDTASTTPVIDTSIIGNATTTATTTTPTTETTNSTSATSTDATTSTTSIPVETAPSTPSAPSETQSPADNTPAPTTTTQEVAPQPTDSQPQPPVDTPAPATENPAPAQQ